MGSEGSSSHCCAKVAPNFLFLLFWGSAWLPYAGSHTAWDLAAPPRSEAPLPYCCAVISLLEGECLLQVPDVPKNGAGHSGVTAGSVIYLTEKQDALHRWEQGSAKSSRQQGGKMLGF